MTSRTPGKSTDDRRAVRARIRAACAAAGLLVTAIALAGGPPATPHAPATHGDCQNLLKQFDVAWPAHREGTRAAGAHRSRDLGEADCRAGRYTDGVRNLRHALHEIGVKPVKSVALAPAH